MNKFNILDRVAHVDYDDVCYVVAFRKTPSGEFEYEVVSSLGGVYLHNVRETRLQFIGSTPVKEKYEYLAMYIIVKDTVPTGLGVNACSHAGFLASKFRGNDMKDWEQKSFRKRTCLVTPEQFDECIEAMDEIQGEYILFRENDWNDEIISAAFAPRYSFPPIFKQIKLHPGTTNG